MAEKKTGEPLNELLRVVKDKPKKTEPPSRSSYAEARAKRRK